MTLELPHATTSHTAKESGGTSTRTSKPGAQTKGGGAADPLGFLALLMELDLQPQTDTPADPLALGLDTAAQMPLVPDTTIAVIDADKLLAPVALPTALVVPGQERRVDKGLADIRVPGALDSVLAADEKGAKAGRSLALRATPEPLGTMDTRQLQLESQRGQPDMAVVREQQRPAQEAMTVSAASAQAVASAPVEESRKVLHTINAKSESTDSMVVLAGLSGAMAGTPELMPVDKQNQVQSAIAQEVSYFISKDIQNAEMKLEGLGGAAVEVSINMQGKEAQVVFRSDEVQTREVLENASAHLRDMLQQEGVVLTDVFVGSSGAGDSGQQDRKFRQGGRSETMLLIQPAVPSATAPLTGVGRTLDLYV